MIRRRSVTDIFTFAIDRGRCPRTVADLWTEQVEFLKV